MNILHRLLKLEKSFFSILKFRCCIEYRSHYFDIWWLYLCIWCRSCIYFSNYCLLYFLFMAFRYILFVRWRALFNIIIFNVCLPTIYLLSFMLLKMSVWFRLNSWWLWDLGVKKKYAITFASCKVYICIYAIKILLKFPKSPAPLFQVHGIVINKSI